MEAQGSNHPLRRAVVAGLFVGCLVVAGAAPAGATSTTGSGGVTATGGQRVDPAVGLPGVRVPKPKKPGAPTDVTAYAVNGGAGVTWSAPLSDGGSPITGYTVTAPRGDETCTTTTAMTCELTGLTNGRTYGFKVQASNSVGTGKAVRDSVTPSTLQDCSYLGPNANLQNCDLAGADLAGIDLAGADLSGVTSGGITGVPAALPTDWSLVDGYLLGAFADLTGADLSGADLHGVDLVGAKLHSADLSGADLTGADLSFSTLTDADLTDTNLTDDGVNYLVLTGATLTGSDWAGTDPSEEISGGLVGTPSTLPPGWVLVNGYLAGEQANLNGADLSGADLSGVNLFDASFTGADLNGTDLAGANLVHEISGGITGTPSALPSGWSVVSGFLEGPGADFDNGDLTGIDLAGLDLTGATFWEADLTDTDLADANLTGTYFGSANLGGTDLAGATLTGVESGGITGTPAALPPEWILVGGYLAGPGAYLENANLKDAQLAGQDLSDADLTDANLMEANLTGADLTGATLTGVTWSDTICPDGTNSDLDAGTCVDDLG